LAESRYDLPPYRPRGTPPYQDIHKFEQRNRSRDEDREEFDRQRRRWYEENRHPERKPPMDVPPPHCSRFGECNEIGRRRW
jgi:hypothetical protein